MIPRALIFGLLLASGATAALADGGTAEERKACKQDVRKVCADVDKKAGEDAYKACLQQNFAKLSKKCQDALMAHH